MNDSGLDKIWLRRKVGMVFQQFNLFPHKTALENITMAPIKVLKQPRLEVVERARGLLAKVRLTGKEDSLSRRAVGRPAAACGDRPLASDGAGCDLVRRGDRRA